LVNEVHEIGDTVEELRSKMKDVEQTMNNLCLTRSSLECDLNIKNNAIHVDRDMVLSLRKSYDMCPKRTVTY
jgi:Tektin family